MALGQHVRAQLALGRGALAANDPGEALAHFESALHPPKNLGEARHPLANCGDIRYWLGVALEALGRRAEARQEWRAAANFRGDFQEMRVRTYSEMTYSSALALGKLGKAGEMRCLLMGLLSHARKLATAEATIDYFATSLPTMLLFEDDLRRRQGTSALFLRAQAQLGIGRKALARRLLGEVLDRDPNHAMAADLLNDVLPMKAKK